MNEEEKRNLDFRYGPDAIRPERVTNITGSNPYAFRHLPQSRTMGDFVYDNFGWFLVLAIAALVAFAVVAGTQEETRFNALMAECRKDHKEYECVAMLKTNRSSSTYIPVVIPAGGRR